MRTFGLAILAYSGSFLGAEILFRSNYQLLVQFLAMWPIKSYYCLVLSTQYPVRTFDLAILAYNGSFLGEG